MAPVCRLRPILAKRRPAVREFVIEPASSARLSLTPAAPLD
jgi:hypothetical protein